MRKLTLVVGILYVAIRHKQYLVEKKKAYEEILATIPNCATCPLRRLNALVKAVVAESRIMDEEDRVISLR